MESNQSANLPWLIYNFLFDSILIREIYVLDINAHDYSLADLGCAEKWDSTVTCEDPTSAHFSIFSSLDQNHNIGWSSFTVKKCSVKTEQDD